MHWPVTALDKYILQQNETKRKIGPQNGATANTGTYYSNKSFTRAPFSHIMSLNITGNFIVTLGADVFDSYFTNDPTSFFQDNHWPLISITSITTKAPSGVIRYLVIVQTMTLADQTEILTNSHCLLGVITSSKSHVYVMKWSTKVPMYLKAAISQSLVSVGGGTDYMSSLASYGSWWARFVSVGCSVFRRG